MTSHLRQHSSFQPFSAHNTASSYPHCTSPPPAKRQRKMTITQTYRLVHSARGKLSKEAQRGEHDLRLLVGHANLLDSLMAELEQAEVEQEQWFNNTVSIASKDESKHVTFQAVEMPAALDSETDSDEEQYDEVGLVNMIPLRSTKQSSQRPQWSEIQEFGVDDEEDGEDEDNEDDVSDDEDADNMELSLCRTHSRSETHSHHLPELVSDSDDSDDDSPPTSPPTIDYTGSQSNFGLLQQQQQQQQQQQELQSQSKKINHSEAAAAALFEDDGFYIPNQSPMIAAC